MSARSTCAWWLAAVLGGLLLVGGGGCIQEMPPVPLNDAAGSYPDAGAGLPDASPAGDGLIIHVDADTPDSGQGFADAGVDGGRADGGRADGGAVDGGGGIVDGSPTDGTVVVRP